MNEPNPAPKSEVTEENHEISFLAIWSVNSLSTTWTKALKDWTQIFYQVGLGAAALRLTADK
jgi:hypothetical protein